MLKVVIFDFFLSYIYVRASETIQSGLGFTKPQITHGKVFSDAGTNIQYQNYTCLVMLNPRPGYICL